MDVCVCVLYSESSVRMLASSHRLVYIVRDGSLQSRVSVRCQSLGGSAVPLVDYIPVYSTLLVFNVGVRSQTVDIITLNAGNPVPDLTFHVVLFSVQGLHHCHFCVFSNDFFLWLPILATVSLAYYILL